ncbi:MAG: DUF262 domain-containing protein [Bacillaceae bacterium]|nr:DUF262 domain-containing protein [Bacillaceae bacterium]
MDEKNWEVESTPDSKTLKSVCDEIDSALKGEPGIKLDPEYQREYKFTTKDESLLIESILMGIPIPVIYLSSDTTKIPHVSNVIDGQHRLRAVYRFINGKFALKGLERYKDLNEKKFDELPVETQNKLLFQSNLSFQNIHVQNNPELEMEIFKRYNQGTNPLSKQEIRHAVFRSEFNMWFNKKVDQFFSDSILKDIYNISKKRYSDKTAHESIYVMLSILENGLNSEYNTSPEYAEAFMKYAAEYATQEDLIKNYGDKLEKVNEFLVKIHQELEIKYPFSKEIYGVQSRNYKLQTPILMIISAFLHYLLNNHINLVEEDKFKKIIETIKETLSNSYLEKPFKGSNTRPSALLETFDEMKRNWESKS